MRTYPQSKSPQNCNEKIPLVREGKYLKREDKKMSEKKWYYYRSTLTGQCYKTDFLPLFGGYVEISDAEYKRYCSVMLGLK